MSCLRPLRAMALAATHSAMIPTEARRRLLFYPHRVKDVGMDSHQCLLATLEVRRPHEYLCIKAGPCATITMCLHCVFVCEGAVTADNSW